MLICKCLLKFLTKQTFKLLITWCVLNTKQKADSLIISTKYLPKVLNYTIVCFLLCYSAFCVLSLQFSGFLQQGFAVLQQAFPVF